MIGSTETEVDADPETGWAADEQGATLLVWPHGPAATTAVDQHLGQLVADRVASRIAAVDRSLWQPAAGTGFGTAAPDTGHGLGWPSLPESSRALLGPIRELRQALRQDGVHRIVLSASGGPAIAARAIAASSGCPLHVLDGTDPGQVTGALVDPGHTALVICDQPNSLQADSHRRIFEQAFTAAGVDPESRMVSVTAGPAAEQAAPGTSFRAVFSTEPHLAGCFAALTAATLVPTGLAGADVEALLDEAAAIGEELSEDSEINPALVLGAVLGGTEPLRDKIAIVDVGSGLPGLADWIEQLLAGCTGRRGTGLLPVVTDGLGAPEIRWPAGDVLVVRLVHSGADEGDPHPAGSGVQIGGPLGAQFLIWQYAAVVAGRLLGLNPSDALAEDRTPAAGGGLAARPPTAEVADPPLATDGPIEIRATRGLLGGPETVPAAVTDLLAAVPPDGYLAVSAFLDPAAAAELTSVREALALRCERPTTFGWGPGCLAATGGFHLEGPAVGAHLQITADPDPELAVPGQDYGFGQLTKARAAAAAAALAARGRPVLRLHLTDRRAGLAQLVAALDDRPAG